MPYHVVIMDGGSVTPDSQLGADGIDGVCVIDLSGSVAPTVASRTMLRLHVTPDRLQMLKRDRTGKDIADPARQARRVRLHAGRGPGPAARAAAGQRGGRGGVRRAVRAA